MKKAAVAVTHRPIEIIHRHLREGSEYVELGANFHDLTSRRTAKKLTGRLQQLGLEVTIRPRHRLRRWQ